MKRPTRQYQTYEQAVKPSYTHNFITVGIVVDTNDSLESGRVRVVCPFLGESVDSPIEDIPWAIQIAPFAGSVSNQKIGPSQVVQQGTVSYGMIATPKIGAQVAVVFIDGNPKIRAYFGGILDNFKMHTMPHGRWNSAGNDERPVPVTSEETKIITLDDSAKKHFTEGTKAYELRTRMADRSVSALPPKYLNLASSNTPDDPLSGYTINRILENGPDPNQTGYLDNQVTCLVSAGLHAVSMDDRPENCRIRLRTATGHQIILDDTNERIYISTTGGSNWIEMDQRGNIDMYTSKNYSIHAEGDINFLSDKKINFYAKEGINLKSDKDIRQHAKENLEVKVEKKYNVEVQDMSFKVNNDVDMSVTNSVKVNSQNFNVTGADGIFLTGESVHNDTEAGFFITGTLNVAGAIRGPLPSGAGTPATPATNSSVENVQVANYVSRTPNHEPWGRSMVKNTEQSLDPELEYDDPNMGKVENGRQITRNPLWKR